MQAIANMYANIAIWFARTTLQNQQSARAIKAKRLSRDEE